MSNLTHPNDTPQPDDVEQILSDPDIKLIHNELGQPSETEQLLIIKLGQKIIRAEGRHLTVGEIVDVVMPLIDTAVAEELEKALTYENVKGYIKARLRTTGNGQAGQEGGGMNRDEIHQAALKAMEATNLCMLHMQYHGQQTPECTPQERQMIELAPPKTEPGEGKDV